MKTINLKIVALAILLSAANVFAQPLPPGGVLCTNCPPDTNIDATRQFGESLLEMMGKDKTGFDEWCDKVGNNWVDAPLYNSPDSQVPNSDKSYGFQTLRSYGNEKPWVINFIITDR